MAWFFPLCLILMFVPLIVSESLSCTWIEHNAIEEDDAKEVKLKRIPENKPTYDPKRKTRLYNVSASVAGTLELDCGLCSISNVDVMAHSEYSKNSCQGLTQELKTSSMDCWWKNNCTVTYIPSIIVFPEKEMPPYCFGKETNVIELKYSCVENYGTLMNDVIPKVQTIQSNKGYIQAILTEEKAFHSDHLLSQIRRFRIQIKPKNASCTEVHISLRNNIFQQGNRWLIEGDGIKCESINKNTTSIPKLNGSFINVNLNLDNAGLISKSIFFFESSETYYMIPENESRNPKGIIRSHSYFPWNYPRPVGALDKHLWTYYLYHIRPPKSDKFLTLKMDKLRIVDGDTLNFIHGEKTFTLKETETRVIEGCQRLTINFTLLHAVAGYYPTDSGFLLFYEWSDIIKRSSFDFLLNANMKKKAGQQVPLKCQQKKVKQKNNGEEKPKRKKNDSPKSKKNGKKKSA
ncbi:uncharacterized protein LOC106060782 isoform X2 [Biomphalaria glabrata]|uniref:Uncharacterized protein LOC106060782 isoform X2 n=1 Tax=Biomphalaria glabrata TaxID=6526 RepID=A0A9W3BDR0_BIOGL|nr:uncharacterized protein LOC106060782 isoform X2 [Biomphalaria glabrata]